MPVAEHLRAVLKLQSDALEEGLAADATRAGLTRTHNYIKDFETLHNAISARPEATLFYVGITEYQYSLAAVSSGQYRHAFMSLRLSYELMLAAIHFSAYEIRFRRWALNASDIVWASLTDSSEGVFAHNFIAPFFPELAPHGKQFQALATTLYREMSEYVHGNAATHGLAKDGLKFDASITEEWLTRADTLRLTLLFAFSARFLALLPQPEAATLEGMLLADLGHLPPIRAIFEAAP